MNRAQATDQRRLYILRTRDYSIGRRPRLSWQVRAFQAGVWVAAGALAVVLLGLAFLLGWSIYLLGEHVVRSGAGW